MFAKSATIWRDFLTSVICAGIFTVIYGVCLFRMGATETQIILISIGISDWYYYWHLLFLGSWHLLIEKETRICQMFRRKGNFLSKVEWTKFIMHRI